MYIIFFGQCIEYYVEFYKTLHSFNNSIMLAQYLHFLCISGKKNLEQRNVLQYKSVFMVWFNSKFKEFQQSILAFWKSYIY